MKMRELQNYFKMFNWHEPTKFLCALLVASFGIYWAILILGPVALDTNNLTWLWGDLAQVHIAWSKFLSDPNTRWLNFNQISYPIPISVSLFDPMPIFLLLAKPFNGFLTEGRQYFGLYFAMSLILQGVLGYFASIRTMQLIGVNEGAARLYISVIVGMLFISMPYTSHRFQGHTALSSQWILALSILVTLLTISAKRQMWMLGNGAVIFFATGLNPYLALMTLINSSIICAFNADRNRLSELFVRVVFSGFVAIMGFWIFGFLGAAGISGGGYGTYSMNIIGFLDSNGVAGLLPIDVSDPTGGQTFEGYVYIGAGLILLSLLVPFSLANYKIESTKFPFLPVIAVCVVLFIVSLSTTITLASHVWQLPIPEFINDVLSRFRSSGRFFWLIGFWLILTLVALTVLRYGTSFAVFTLTLALVIQLFDVRPIALDVKRNIASFAALDLTIIETKMVDSVLVYPPWQCNNQETPGGARNYEFVGNLARILNVPTNNFYAARTPVVHTSYHCDIKSRLTEINYRAIYLLSPDLYKDNEGRFSKAFRCSVRGSVGRDINYFYACIPKY